MRSTRTARMVPLLLLAGGLALSACSSGAGTEDGAAGASATRTTTSATAATGPSVLAPSPSGTTAGSPAPTAAPEPSGADATTAGGPDRCHSSELTADTAIGDSGAGQRSLTLVLTNTGGEVCTVYGYGGIGLVAQDGASVPTAQDRVTSPAPRTVTLQPGQAASSRLGWTAVPSGSEPTTGDCEPQAVRLAVVPPDETDPVSVSWPGGPVCDGGRIAQNAYTTA